MHYLECIEFKHNIRSNVENCRPVQNRRSRVKCKSEKRASYDVLALI